MSLKEYIKKHKITKRIEVLMLDGSGKVLIPMSCEAKDFKHMSKELMELEVMDISEEDDCIEVWLL